MSILMQGPLELCSETDRQLNAVETSSKAAPSATLHVYEITHGSIARFANKAPEAL
jgi:hypothetical protein